MLLQHLRLFSGVPEGCGRGPLLSGLLLTCLDTHRRELGVHTGLLRTLNIRFAVQSPSPTPHFWEPYALPPPHARLPPIPTPPAPFSNSFRSTFCKAEQGVREKASLGPVQQTFPGGPGMLRLCPGQGPLGDGPLHTLWDTRLQGAAGLMRVISPRL